MNPGASPAKEVASSVPFNSTVTGTLVVEYCPLCVTAPSPVAKITSDCPLGRGLVASTILKFWSVIAPDGGFPIKKIPGATAVTVTACCNDPYTDCTRKICTPGAIVCGTSALIRSEEHTSE